MSSTVKSRTLQGANISAQQPPVRKIDQYVGLSHDKYIAFKNISKLVWAGWFEVLEGFKADPDDDNSSISYSLYYNDTDDHGTGNPAYYVYMTTHNRLYTCQDVFEVVLLVTQYRAMLQKELDARASKKPSRS